MLSAAFILLGVTVFFWGLRYKLSLYDPPQASSHHMTAAKLLTDRERDKAPSVQRPESHPPVPEIPAQSFVALLSLIATIAMMVRFRNWQASESLVPQKSYLRVTPLFHRPPPTRL
ncbi:hypothetical protein C7378_1412 [Acidipila rosea]|uniref:Uncharacterized protein n=2 Tax=Acidipila rosea TaxID=768535 RepID=A0A4R1L6I4_9BACT|nr:hypothetical protein C7378_1412 [Acidipila rosea]